MPPTPSTGCPPFYACYLLKSIQTPTSTATYIGSTPHPPRRIRQHNGELTQGAWKTRSKRPWIMSMIVYGFPSKLTALQFEWAWQHVHKTRHLRDANGKALLSRSSGLNSNIRAVRLMLATHPYSTWPLHVKLFTDAAVKGWTLAQKSAPALPPGFTYQIELEGVDGKSGKAGSGRDGPLAVDDAQFTSVLLAKNTALLASSGAISCIICKEHIPNYTADALSTGLCPAPSCSAVAHLTCLSTRFITEQAHSSSDILPRGGDCPVCGTYALWGDVVRGSFRRAAGGIPLELEDDDALFMPDSESDGEAVPTGKPSAKKAARKRPGDNSSEGEEFDFAVAERSSSESEADAPRKRRRPRQEKLPASPRKKAKSQGPSQKRGRPPTSRTNSPGEAFDFEGISADSAEDRPSPKKRTRAPKLAPDPQTPRKRGRPPKASTDSPGEAFDFDQLTSSSDGDEASPRKRVRTRKPFTKRTPPRKSGFTDIDSSDLFESDSEDEGRLANKMKALSVEAEDVIIVSD